MPESSSLFFSFWLQCWVLVVFLNQIISIIYFKSARKQFLSTNTSSFIHPFSHSLHPKTCVVVSKPSVICYMWAREESSVLNFKYLWLKGGAGGQRVGNIGYHRSCSLNAYSPFMLCVACVSVLLNRGPKMRRRQLWDDFKKDISGRETVDLKTLRTESV